MLVGGRSAADAPAAPARLGLGLDREAARTVVSLSVEGALLSTFACGSVAAAAEAPRCTAASPERARGRRRPVWRSSMRAGLSAATLSPLVASFACLLICRLAIAVFPLGRHRATRDACTTPSPAFEGQAGRRPQGSRRLGQQCFLCPGSRAQSALAQRFFLRLERRSRRLVEPRFAGVRFAPDSDHYARHRTPAARRR